MLNPCYTGPNRIWGKEKESDEKFMKLSIIQISKEGPNRPTDQTTNPFKGSRKHEKNNQRRSHLNGPNVKSEKRWIDGQTYRGTHV